MTDALAGDAASLLAFLRQATGIGHWVGTTGFGVAGNGVELYDQPAVSLLVGSFPQAGFRILPPVAQDQDGFLSASDVWLSQQQPLFGVVHGDPRNPMLPDLIAGLSEQTSSFLVGGQRLGRPRRGGGAAGRRGLGGRPVGRALFGQGLAVAAGLSQGCQPIGPGRRITAGERNIVMTLDERPALEALLEDLGLESAEELQQAGSSTLVAFPIAGSDTGDYLVRNLMGIDPERGWLAIGDMVETGRDMMFCRRDGHAAEADLKRMLNQVKGRLNGPPRGGLYFSCIARGVNLFGPDSAELRLIRAELGDLPLAGFYANGEISNNRLYGYTGVLALFL